MKKSRKQNQKRLGKQSQRRSRQSQRLGKQSQRRGRQSQRLGKQSQRLGKQSQKYRVNKRNLNGLKNNSKSRKITTRKGRKGMGTKKIVGGGGADSEINFAFVLGENGSVNKFFVEWENKYREVTGIGVNSNNKLFFNIFKKKVGGILGIGKKDIGKLKMEEIYTPSEETLVRIFRGAVGKMVEKKGLVPEEAQELGSSVFFSEEGIFQENGPAIQSMFEKTFKKVEDKLSAEGEKAELEVRVENPSGDEVKVAELIDYANLLSPHIPNPFTRMREMQYNEPEEEGLKSLPGYHGKIPPLTVGEILSAFKEIKKNKYFFYFDKESSKVTLYTFVEPTHKPYKFEIDRVGEGYRLSYGGEVFLNETIYKLIQDLMKRRDSMNRRILKGEPILVLDSYPLYHGKKASDYCEKLLTTQGAYLFRWSATLNSYCFTIMDGQTLKHSPYSLGYIYKVMEGFQEVPSEATIPAMKFNSVKEYHGILTEQQVNQIIEANKVDGVKKYFFYFDLEKNAVTLCVFKGEEVRKESIIKEGDSYLFLEYAFKNIEDAINGHKNRSHVRENEFLHIGSEHVKAIEPESMN